VADGPACCHFVAALWILHPRPPPCPAPNASWA
jgi:hypothetical protein